MRLSTESDPSEEFTVKSVDESSDQIIYLLTLINQPRLTIQIEVCLVHLLKNGEYGKPQLFDYQHLRHSPIFSAADRHICYWLASAKIQNELVPIETKFFLQGSQ